MTWNNSNSEWEAAASTGGSGGGVFGTVIRQTKVATSTIGATGATITWAHGQSTEPVLYWLELTALSDQFGFSTGDTRQIWPNGDISDDILTIYQSTGELLAAISDDLVLEYVARADTGDSVNALTQWEVGLAGLWLVDSSGADFDGDYNSLTNKPTLFDGAYGSLTGTPDLGNIPQNAPTGAYDLVASDAGGHVSADNNVTVDASVFSVGDAVSIYNETTGDITITEGTGVTMRLAGTATDGDRTLAQYGLCTLLCVGTDTFVISGVGLT